MKTTVRLLAICALAHLVIACGDGNGGGSGSGSPAPDGDPVAKAEIGDGIGSHGKTREALDREILQQLIADGADPKKPHLIEHHFAVAVNPGKLEIEQAIKAAREIVEWGKANGFTTDGFDESKVTPNDWLLIDLVKPTKLELNLLWYDSKRMETLAAKLDCEYDGWGCEIIN